MFGFLLGCCICSGCACPTYTYYPHNCYFATYSAYPPYSCGCYGCYDPYFSFGCSGYYGCAGWGPPVAYPYCGPVVIAPADSAPNQGNKGAEKGVSDKLDDVLKAVQQIKDDSKKSDMRLKAIEDEIQKLKKPGPGPKPEDKKPEDKKPEDKKPDAKPKEPIKMSHSDRAILVVQLPAAAKLFLDDQATNSQGKAQRTILTPQLEPATYSYTLRAEIVSGGKTITQTRHVSFQAGQQIQVIFEAMTETPTDAAFSEK